MAYKVVHLVTGLGLGGAETMLSQIIKFKQNEQIEYKVISLCASHYYEDYIRNCGVDIVEFNVKKKPVSSFLNICKLAKDADILSCWCYNMNFLGYIVNRFAKTKLVWNIRHSNVKLKNEKLKTFLFNKMCAKFSKKVDVVTFNGEKSKSEHIKFGYCSKNAIVLNNGCDFDIYKPDASAENILRNELKIGTDKKIVLSVSRYVPIKDIPTFLQAFKLLSEKEPNSVAVMCGQNIDNFNAELLNQCSKYGLNVGENVFLLGKRSDVPLLLAACDLYVLHSASEAFPNTLLQAMATGCLCVATDVGETREILSDDSKIVQPGDFLGLSNVMYNTITDFENKGTLSNKNRNSVIAKYNIRSIVNQYENVYLKLA